MADFLIVKRAMAQSDDNRVTFGINDPTFTSAVSEVMGTTPPEGGPAPAPFINVFGTGSHNDHGYRQARYISNGTGVTVPRWTNVIVQVAVRPAVVEFAPDYLNHLEEFLLVGKRAARPRLDDAAVWYYRFTDLAGVPGIDPVTVEAVTQAFIGELALTQDEIQLLFDESADIEEGNEDG